MAQKVLPIRLAEVSLWQRQSREKSRASRRISLSDDLKFALEAIADRLLAALVGVCLGIFVAGAACLTFVLVTRAFY
jgi:hypothetical protein